VEVIREIARNARHTLHMVDQLDLGKWLNSPVWQEYLDMQRNTVSQGQNIERIRVVDQSRVTEKSMCITCSDTWWLKGMPGFGFYYVSEITSMRWVPLN
jgi:hypothetical protein